MRQKWGFRFHHWVPHVEPSFLGGLKFHPYFEVFIKTLPCFPWVLGGPKGNVDEILLRIHRYTICSCNNIYIYTYVFVYLVVGQMSLMCR